MSDTWTIGELAERAAALLGREPQARKPRAGNGEPQAGGREPHANGPGAHANGPEARVSGPGARVNGRVREVPNERLIRWYTTIGLLDPPLGRRGRVALYGRRHLLQLVAIKRRQADGRSIAEIQAELAGATDAMLQRVAGITEPELRPLAPRSPYDSAAKHPSGAPPAPSAPGRGGTTPDAGAEPAVPDITWPPARDRFWAYPAAHADGTRTAAGHHGTSEPPDSAPVPGTSPEDLLPVAAPSPEAPAPEIAPYADALRPAAARRESGYEDTTPGGVAQKDTPHRDPVVTGRRDAAHPYGTRDRHIGTAREDTAHEDTAHEDTVPPDAGRTDTARTDTGRTDTGRTDTGRTDTGHANAVHPDLVYGVRLAPGVTILLDSAHRAPDGHEVAALRSAAAPLLTALATLGLAGPFGDARGAHHTHDNQAGDQRPAEGMTS